MKNDATKAKDGGEYVRQRAKVYREKDPEKHRARSRAYFEAHKDEHRARAKIYYQETRENTPWSTLIDSAKFRAKKKGLPFDLTKAWAQSRWTGFCEVTKLPFLIGAAGMGPRPMAATIDRIDPKLGYVQANCRIILQAVNALKATMTDAEMIEVAKAIIANINL